MKIEVGENGEMILTEVYSSIELQSKDGESLSIVMRDSGFEFKYFGKTYELKEGTLTEMKIGYEKRNEDIVLGKQDTAYIFTLDKEYIGVIDYEEYQRGFRFHLKNKLWDHSEVLGMFDLVEDEMLAIGIPLDCSIVGSWYNDRMGTNMRLTETALVTDFGVSEFSGGTKIPYFELDGYCIPLVGFRKYYTEELKKELNGY